MELLIKKTQEEFKAQPFGWSLIARKEFNSIPKFEAFNWKKKYPDMDVDISITIEIGQFGTQSSVPNIKEVKEKYGYPCIHYLVCDFDYVFIRIWFFDYSLARTK